MYTEITNKYNIQEELGRGAYGIVKSALNKETNQGVAIKKISKIFNKTLMTKRTLREIKLLRLFNGHNNIASLKDLEIESDNFNELYVVEDLMEADLNLIIKSKQKLSTKHYQYFIYQIAKGMKYVHSANVIHRDLKPGNILVNSDCSLKICDFGLARNLSEPEKGDSMTEYVVTRWYRAPEVMISTVGYSKALDVWSIGCIFAELLGGEPLFKGKDYVDQIAKIILVIGTPSEESLKKVTNKAKSFILSLPRYEQCNWENLFPNASTDALDLLEKMLQFDPDKRITIDEILEHSYLKNYHDEAKEPVCKGKFDISFENAETTSELKEYIVEEVKKFK